jgi:hypothetical protein
MYVQERVPPNENKKISVDPGFGPRSSYLISVPFDPTPKTNLLNGPLGPELASIQPVRHLVALTRIERVTRGL